MHSTVGPVGQPFPRWLNTVFTIGTIVATLLTPIGSYFNRLNQSSYIGTSYLLSVCCFTPLYGRLSDILGRKGAMLLALSFFGKHSIAFSNTCPIVCSRIWDNPLWSGSIDGSSHSSPCHSWYGRRGVRLICPLSDQLLITSSTVS